MNQQRRQFYTNAFRSANPNASGSISARNAVHLLRKSMLPKDSNPGRTLSVDALTPEVLNGLPIPKLSGFGASPKMAAASSSNGISNIGSDLVQLPKQSVSPWIISRSDRVKYEQFFSSFGAQEVQGVQARGLFLKSGLAPDMVNKVFSMCDLDRNGSLDRDEFCIAMHLVVNASKRGVAVPSTLPMTLVPPAKRHHLVSTNTTASVPIPAATNTNVVERPKTTSVGDAFGSSMSNSMNDMTTAAPTTPVASNGGVTESLYNSVASNAALQSDMNKSLSQSRNGLTQVAGHLLDDLRQRLEQVKIQAAAQKVAMSRANEALQQEHLVMQNLMKEIMEEQARLKNSTEETERIRAQLVTVRNQIEETRSKKHESFKQHAESHVEMLQLTKELKRANYELEEIETEIEQQTKNQSDLNSAKTISEAARTIMNMIEDVQTKQKAAREKLNLLRKENTGVMRSLSNVSGDTPKDKLSSARKKYVEAKKSAENVDMTTSDTIDAFKNFGEEELPPPRIPSKKEIFVKKEKKTEEKKTVQVSQPASATMDDAFEAFGDDDNGAVVSSTTSKTENNEFEAFDADAAFDAFPSTTEDVGGDDGFDAFPTGEEEEKNVVKDDVSPPKPPKTTKPKKIVTPTTTKRAPPPPIPTENGDQEDEFNAFDEFPENENDADGGFDAFPMDSNDKDEKKEEKKEEVESTPQPKKSKRDVKDDTNAFSTEGFEDWDDLDSPGPSGDAGWADFS